MSTERSDEPHRLLGGGTRPDAGEAGWSGPSGDAAVNVADLQASEPPEQPTPPPEARSRRSAPLASPLAPVGGEPIVRLEGVVKDHIGPRNVVHALREVDLEVRAGEMFAVHGRSGSGKTTLLNVIGGLDRADSGRIEVCGIDLGSASDEQLAAMRRTDVSFVFQAFGLLPVLTAAENVEIPLRLHGLDPGARAERVRELLDLVGLGRRARHRPSELSGGEQQRVSIARALAATPSLLIADEPTGQLDSRTGGEVMLLIQRVVVEQGVAAIVATHDSSFIDLAHTHVELSDGVIVG